MLARIALVAILIASSGVASADFLETFTYPDGTFPPGWTWTGDPRGEGQFWVYGGIFVHTEGRFVHYFRDVDVLDSGSYCFSALDNEWSFAWRIAPANPVTGRCFILLRNASWDFMLVKMLWRTLDGYPEGQYMWHNGNWEGYLQHSSEPDPGVWHDLEILDSGTTVVIRVDGESVISLPYDPSVYEAGYIGLGAGEYGEMTPAFDNVCFNSLAVPVETGSWGTIKAMFR